MRKFCVVLVVFFASVCSGGPLHFKPRSDLISTIVGGQDVDITAMPYQLSLEQYGGHVCGAAILTSNIAITAAHCAETISSYGSRLRAGTSIVEYGGSVHQISSYIIHPYYNDNIPDYDVALLFVSESFHFDATRQPINICGSEPTSGLLTVSGWGLTSADSTQLSDQLQAVTVPVVGRYDCNLIYSSIGGITTRMFCAGSTGHDACYGDSGGPAIRGGVLYGLVSWGLECGLQGYPGVYTNLAQSEIREWIKNNAGV